MLSAIGAGVAIAFVPYPFAAFPVAVLLVCRLACANLDGTVARQANRRTRLGAVLNEVGDRLADLAVIAGVMLHVPLELAVATALASSMPSWISLAGTAAGLDRINGGPVGKTERCLGYVLMAATGWYLAGMLVVAFGSVVTALLRFRRLSAMGRQQIPVEVPVGGPA